jgi:hypothetical protein
LQREYIRSVETVIDGRRHECLILHSTVAIPVAISMSSLWGR